MQLYIKKNNTLTHDGLPPSRSCTTRWARRVTSPPPVSCVWGDLGGGEKCKDATCPSPREGTTGPEGARKCEKRPPATAWGNWASIPLAENACSAIIGGQRKTPSVIGCGGVFFPRRNRNADNGKTKNRVVLNRA
jgi:hypothetical protein